MMKILNWNAQGDRLTLGTEKFERLRRLIISHDADVICLTEAFPELLPNGGNFVTSNRSGWTRHEDRGARKVVLWCRTGWRNVDRQGSNNLPEGRFVLATTTFERKELTFVGMCIPYAGYRTNKNWWGTRKKMHWEGACEYLDVLRDDILTRGDLEQKSILLGDFNLQIPPKGCPGKNSTVNRKREATFSGWLVPTAGTFDDPALDRSFIDHIALSPDIVSQPPHFFSRFDRDGTCMSDHNGVCIEIELP